MDPRGTSHRHPATIGRQAYLQRLTLAIGGDMFEKRRIFCRDTEIPWWVNYFALASSLPQKS